MSMLRPSECSHERTRIRRRTYRNGAPVVWAQCPDCGGPGKGKNAAISFDDAKKRGAACIEDLAPFDEDAFRAWEQNKFDEEREERERAAAAKRRDERSQRAPYYQSPEWKAKREKVLRRAGGRCEGCDEKKATEVHHVSYDHFGNEMLWELRAVCDDCHERIHADHHAREQQILDHGAPFAGGFGSMAARIVNGIDPEP